MFFSKNENFSFLANQFVMNPAFFARFGWNFECDLPLYSPSLCRSDSIPKKIFDLFFYYFFSYGQKFEKIVVVPFLIDIGVLVIVFVTQIYDTPPTLQQILFFTNADITHISQVETIKNDITKFLCCWELFSFSFLLFLSLLVAIEGQGKLIKCV